MDWLESTWYTVLMLSHHYTKQGLRWKLRTYAWPPGFWQKNFQVIYAALPFSLICRSMLSSKGLSAVKSKKELQNFSRERLNCELIKIKMCINYIQHFNNVLNYSWKVFLREIFSFKNIKQKISMNLVRILSAICRHWIILIQS